MVISQEQLYCLRFKIWCERSKKANYASFSNLLYFIYPAIFLILLFLALLCFQIGSRLRLHTLFITKISAQTWDCLCSEVNIQHNNPFHLLFNLFHNICLSTEALAPLTSMRNMFLRNHKSSIMQPSHALSNLLRKTEKPGNSK